MFILVFYTLGGSIMNFGDKTFDLHCTFRIGMH